MAIGPAGNLEGRTALEFSPLTDILPKHSDGNTNDTVAAPANVAIVGAGRGGTALLELLHQIPPIHIVGIADRDPLAPGLQRARARSLFNVKRPQPSSFILLCRAIGKGHANIFSVG
jgi:hypothetical protein